MAAWSLPIGRVDPARPEGVERRALGGEAGRQARLVVVDGHGHGLAVHGGDDVAAEGLMWTAKPSTMTGEGDRLRRRCLRRSAAPAGSGRPRRVQTVKSSPNRRVPGVVIHREHELARGSSIRVRGRSSGRNEIGLFMYRKEAMFRTAGHRRPW